jgi:hypothetical protein
MVEQDEQAKNLGWLTFTMHPVRLEINQTLVAKGKLIDDKSYALDLKILRMETEAVTFSYTGRVGKHSLPLHDITVPLVAGKPVQLPLTSAGKKSVIAPLYAAWESSVKVVPGETAILIIGQRSEDDVETKGSSLPLPLALLSVSLL